MLTWTLFLVWALVGLTMLVGCIRAGVRSHAFRGVKAVVMGVVMLPIVSALWPLLLTTTIILNLPRLVAAVRN